MMLCIIRTLLLNSLQSICLTASEECTIGVLVRKLSKDLTMETRSSCVPMKKSTTIGSEK